ncbi:xanthine dehydrogenase family protein molybdopterin-binding subunit [Ilyomonas limi]|uniref:Xanthine dehydrogenase family protein molybdopterin-binding subunit n=1 Tax=Ilyomonas limi TaxID=2575867 RepID=A0A4U3L9A5_9BACT|nr:xanthine dehydrogenase family protein molybdopterin-binding subunit [Ilyomonas limi]TKK71670.1 xanthine dehydrogenase family protein molybdopterin-binding subunit [Ilyomonas limi]
MGDDIKMAGQPLSRVDGKLKVTGAAKYAAEYIIPNLAYGVLASGAIARGRIKSIDTAAAEKAPGVIAIITHLNAPKPPGYFGGKESSDPRTEGGEYRVFYNDVILYSGQPVALAIADTFERARYAASLVKVQYVKEPPQTDMLSNMDKAVVPKESDPDYNRGDKNAFDNAAFTFEQEYQTQLQVHNPMEPHAAIAVWEGADAITVYNKTQSSPIAQEDIAKAWKLQKENVHIVSKFVGGAFGGASRVWPEEMAATIGAKKIGRPLKVVFNRDQLFNMVGYRPQSLQKIKLGADKDGKLIGIHHEAYGNTSTYEQFTANMTSLTQALYACDNVSTLYRLVPLDVSTPCWTRAPGEAPGSFALESALDELSYTLKIDPLELRKRNYAAQNPDTKQPWSTKFLNECYERGAAQFGWEKRNPQPRSTTNGNWLIGYGMATGIYGAWRAPSSARAVLNSDGTLVVQSATADVGVGTATIMSQIAADATGIPVEKIKFELGDSRLPPAIGQFGSLTTTSVGSAVNDACVALRQKAIEYLKKSQSSLQNTPVENFAFGDGKIKTKDDAVSISYADLLQQQHLPSIEVTVDSKGSEEADKYSSYSYNATFVEVGVHALTNQLKVNRVVSAIDAGKIMNKKTARSQVYGSVTWGIGMALTEESVIDDRYGRWMVKDLADYHVPVNADIPAIEVLFIDKSDDILTPIGAKGLGEIGIVGVAAAIANAVYHATGKRVRDLPITPDKLV